MYCCYCPYITVLVKCSTRVDQYELESLNILVFSTQIITYLIPVAQKVLTAVHSLAYGQAGGGYMVAIPQGGCRGSQLASTFVQPHPCTLNLAPAVLAYRLSMQDEGKLEELYGIKPGQVQGIRARCGAVPGVCSVCVVHDRAATDWTTV